MTAARNTIFAAMFALTADMALGSTVGTPAFIPFVSRSRKFKNFAKQDASQQPAFAQTEHTEAEAQRLNMPSLRKWFGAWTVHFVTDPQDANDLGAVQINDWLDAFDARLPGPSPGARKQTLGGLVHHAYIDGTIIKVPGDDDGQGLLVVPFTLIVP